MWRTFLTFAAALLPLAAADTGKGDILGQAGLYHESGMGGGSWAIAGGGACVNLGSHVALLGEATYVRPTMNSFGANASGNIFQTGGGLRFYLPVRSDRYRPYVVAAGGYLHMSARLTVFVDPTRSTVSPTSLTVHGIEDGAYAGGGAGLDIVLTRRFGLRPEFRFARQLLEAGDYTTARATVGLFYRFGTR